MRKQPQKKTPDNIEITYANLNTSAESLGYGKPEFMMGQFNHTEESMEKSLANANLTRKQGLDRLTKQDYQPARYNKAVAYRNARSYLSKTASGEYKELDLLGDTVQLKAFGLGAYFYIEFFRRMTWLFFVMTLLQGVCILLNFKGSRLSSYSASFSTYLIKSTIGNYSGSVLTAFDGYLTALIPAVNFLAMTIFYFIWKKHFNGCITEQDEDKNDIKPEKFCLQIEGLQQTFIKEEELNRFFASFGPVYEVSLVRRHKNKLQYFQELDELEEKIREEELQLMMGSGDKEDVQKLKKKKQELLKDISELQISPKTLSAYVHFQFQKSKIECLSYFNEHYLFSGCCHGCARTFCCCCIQQPEQKYLFKGQKLFIKSQKVPTPEDINWEYSQINGCSKFFRVAFSFLIIVIFLAISTTIIGLCSIYISSHSSNCDSITLPSDVATASATANSTIIQCFCNAHFIDAFTDNSIKTFCGSYLPGIYLEQGIQYAVIITSSVTNFLFGLIVDKLVNFIRPASKSSGLMTKTLIYTIFICLNSILVPILIYADIFGFQASNYVSFLTIISSSIKDFLMVTNLSFYPDFTPVWYRNVSPIFTNFLIINTVMVWVFFIIDKYLSSKTSLEKEEGKMLQKMMNLQITSYKLDVYKEAAGFYLVIVMVTLFHSGIPVLIPLGFLNIFTKYIVNRSLLQNNSTRIEGLGQQFSSLTLGLLPFILIISPLIGQWMLIANQYVIAGSSSMRITMLSGIMPELQRQLYLPFYMGISLLVFLQFFLYNTLIRCCSCLCSMCYEKKQVAQTNFTRPFAESAKTLNILCSYNIRNNDHMRNAVLNLDKYMLEKGEK